MKLIVTKGATSQIWLVKARNSSTGAPLTGLAYNTASLVAYYVRPGAVATAITLATQTVTGAYSSGGFVEVDATNMPGIYRFDPPNAVLASGVDNAVVTLKGATNLEQIDLEVQLVSINLQDSVRAGLTALPNAAAEAAGGLYTRGSGAGQIIQPANGRVSVDTIAVSGDTTAADNLESMFDGTGYNASASNVGTVGSVTAVGNAAIAAASFAAGAIDAGALNATAANEIRDAIAALVIEDQPSVTVIQALAYILSFAAGRTTNGGATFQSPNGAETRIQGTVNGSNERTAITLTAPTL
jgi:hypothetical protein